MLPLCCCRVLGFPCNQFGSQEPWERDKIVQFSAETFGVRCVAMEVDHRG